MDGRELPESLNELMDIVDESNLRTDLVYTLLIKAWDIGYCDGCEDVREGMREWANQEG